MASSPDAKILLATNIERGQCSVFLATTAALLRTNPNVDLHFASFPALELDVRAISDEAIRENGATNPVTFHSVGGKTYIEAMEEKIRAKYGENCQFPMPSFAQPINISTSREALQDLYLFLMCWDGPECMEIYESFSNIINDVSPDLIIVDLLFTPAVSAAWNSGVRLSYLSPNSIKDFMAGRQPYLGILWKFPAPMSGYEYPVPWHLKPFNVFLNLYMLYRLLNEPSFAATKKYVEEKTGHPMRSLLDPKNLVNDRVKIFVGSLPEIDFPLTGPLKRIAPCGPIITEAPPVSHSDPELAAWLAQGTTIYVNLGSLYKLSECRAVELARGLNMAMEKLDGKESNRTQVLWKLKKDEDYDIVSPDSKVRAAFFGKMDMDRVRVTGWLETSPLAILLSGNIVCSVHHGGANSYNEAIMAAVPQLVLPFWTDCYDYASRVELLGIGARGCRKRQPIFEARELSEQLLSVVDGENTKDMREKAKKLAELCKKKGKGAENAALGILEIASEAVDLVGAKKRV